MQVSTLKEFVAVVQYGSFTGAAKALYLSQPTLSKHIASLEKELGYKMFFDERPLILTEAGRIVMEHASSVIAQADTMTLRLEKLRHQKPELIRLQDISFFEHIAQRSYELKKTVRRDFPNVTFETVKCKTHQTSLEALESGEIDVGFQFNITDTPLDLRDKEPEGANMIPLFRSSGGFRLGVPKSHPLLQSEKRLTLHDFANQHFFIIANRNNESFIDDFKALCQKEGFLPQIEFVTVSSNRDFWTRDYGNGILFLVATGRRNFTTADEYLRGRYQAIDPFPENEQQSIVISLITRDERHSEALQAFIDAVSAIEERNLAAIQELGAPDHEAPDAELFASAAVM